MVLIFPLKIEFIGSIDLSIDAVLGCKGDKKTSYITGLTALTELLRTHRYC